MSIPLVARAALMTLTALLVPRAACAQDTAAELVWLCWQETRSGYYVRCRLDEDALAQAIGVEFAPAATMPAMESRSLRQELFKPGRAPNVARLVREDPAQYAGLVWSIPLHAMPFDDSPLAELAQSVMCGSDRHCTTHLNTAPLQAAWMRSTRR